jgi:hypothetical protein
VRATAPRSAPPRSEAHPDRCEPVARPVSRACPRLGAVGHRRDLHRVERPSTTASGLRPAADGQTHRRPSTRASAPHHERDERRQHRRPSTRASAHRPVPDERRQHRRPSTTASAHRPEPDERRQHRRPSTTASAHRPEPDEPRQHRRPSTTASAHRPAAIVPRPIPGDRMHVRRPADPEGHRRSRDRTEASRHHGCAESATIRGPGPRARCLDRMSRSLCSCRPRGPDDVCCVVGRTEVKDQANGCNGSRAPPWRMRSSSHPGASRPRPRAAGVMCSPAVAGRSPSCPPGPATRSRAARALTQKGPPHDVRRAFPIILKLSPAVSYSPTGSPLQYHRR